MKTWIPMRPDRSHCGYRLYCPSWSGLNVLLMFLTLGSCRVAGSNITNYLTQPWQQQALGINAGDTVTWLNLQSFPATNFVESYEGAWSSPVLSYGDSFSFTFTNAGFYAYRTGLLLEAFHATTILLPGVVSVSGYSNEAPQLTINFPVDGMVFNIPNVLVPIRLRTSATNTAEAAQIQYFANSNFIGSAVGPEYTLNWSNPPAGSYVLQALSTNQQGIAFGSPLVTVAVGPDAHLWGTRLLVGGRALFFYNLYPGGNGSVLGSSDDTLTNWHGRAVFQDDKGWGIYVDESPPATNSRFYRIGGVSK
jgi:hypothetical protein